MLRPSLVATLVLAAVALFLITSHLPAATPIDRALPLVGVIVALISELGQTSCRPDGLKPAPRAAPVEGGIVALLSDVGRTSVRPGGLKPAPRAAPYAIDLAIPLLAAIAIAVPDERLRLLGYGVVVAAAFAAAAAFAPRTFLDQALLAVAAIVVLRWIPQPEVWRELVVIAGAFALLLAFEEHSPLETIAVVAASVVMPTHPGKALIIPFVLASIVFVTRALPFAAIVAAAFFAVAAITRASIAPIWFIAGVAVAIPIVRRARAAPAVYAIAAALFVLWPWSGLLARAMPRFFAAEPLRGATSIGRALAPSESLEIPVDARRGVTLVASGANIARLRTGRVIGSVEATDHRGRTTTTPLRVGDIADFGFMRRDQFFASRNPMPRRPVADIRGYGDTAFLYGAGRVPFSGDVATLRITAAPNLPANARIEIEAIERQ